MANDNTAAIAAVYSKQHAAAEGKQHDKLRNGGDQEYQPLETVDNAPGSAFQKSLEEGGQEVDEQILSGLYKNVKVVHKHFKNYSNLLWFCIFTAIYIAILSIQASSFQTYLVANGHNSLLPEIHEFGSASLETVMQLKVMGEARTAQEERDYDSLTIELIDNDEGHVQVNGFGGFRRPIRDGGALPNIITYGALMRMPVAQRPAYGPSRMQLLTAAEDYSADAAFSFSSTDEIYDWLNTSIIQTVWAATGCGNGICDRPQEYPAFGPTNRFGCASDCGLFPNVTNITIAIGTSFKTEAEQSASSWNLCLTSPESLCWYEAAQTFKGELSEYQTLQLPLPDGDWAFRLNAPKGGVAAFSYRSADQEASKFLFSLGLGCSENTETTPLSSFSACRAACQDFTQDCFLEECGDSVSSKTVVDAFNLCVRGCWLTETAATLTTNLANWTCAEQLALVIGDSPCEAFSDYDTAILPIEQLVESDVVPTIVPRVAFRETLWEKLGPTDDKRIINLAAAVQRAMYTWIKDECLVSTPKSLSLGPRLTAFFCTYFGGPTNTPECAYRSSRTGELLTNDTELFTEMRTIHSRLTNISTPQEDTFVNIMVLALQSVYLLDESTVVAFHDRLHQLDRVLVTTPVNGCNIVSTYIPFTSTATTRYLFRFIQVGDSVQWIWEDDDEHSVAPGYADESLGAGLYVNLQGFGSNDLIVSRKRICTPDNVGFGGFDSQPVPCNLVDPTKDSRTFKYTHLFDGTGFSSNETSLFAFGSGRSGDSAEGVIYIYGRNSESDSTFSCMPGCTLSMLANGRCDQRCNNAVCAFDAGDCSCPVDENGVEVCSCPPGQTRAYSGECCDDTGVGSNSEATFQLRTYGEDPSISNAVFIPSEDVALIRNVANQNRALVGMYIRQDRSGSTKCDTSETKYTYLQTECSSGSSSAPFGVNPQVLLSSSLYNQEFLEATNEIHKANSSYKNASLAFNAGGIPFGFYDQFAEGRNYGFTYIFDINLNNDDANKLLTYLKDGFFIDNSTQKLNVRLMTYNGDARFFSLVAVDLTFEVGGRVAVKADTRSIAGEHYKGAKDWVRFVLEMIFLFGLVWNTVGELRQGYRLWKKTGFIFAYFKSFWNVVDFISVSIMITGVVLWIRYILLLENQFKVEAKYKIYETPLTPYTYWKLQTPESAFADAASAFQHLDAMADFRGYYTALQGINIFLMVLRILKLMDFQPRMGAITRTIAAAGPDLLHFFILWALVFVSFCFYAHIAFGRIVRHFRTFGSTLNSCFLIIIGQDNSTDYLFQLQGWELVSGVIFWWSFVLIIVFVVMNLLIAIVVDAFTKIKQEVEDGHAPSLPQEVLFMLSTLAKQLTRKQLSHRQQLRLLKDLGAQKSNELGKQTASGGKDGAHHNNNLAVNVDGKLIEFDTMVTILRRAEARKGPSDQKKEGEILKLAEGLFDEMAIDNSAQLEDRDNVDMEALKASQEAMQATLARLEAAVLGLHARLAAG